MSKRGCAPTDAAYNALTQEYKGVPLRLIVRRDYPHRMAKRYTINGTNQNVWIPNKHLTEDGTIKPGQDLDYIFRRCVRQLVLAGVDRKYRSQIEQT